MNVDKMATFLKKLREEKKLTQDQLGAMLNVNRSLISKWEHGSKIPAVDSLTALAKIYDLSIDEIIYGERKNKDNKADIENLSATIINVSRKKIEKAHKVFFIIVGLLIMILLFLYFIFNYNSIKVYNVGAKGTKFDIKNTLLIVSKNKSYIKFGDIVGVTDDEELDYDKYEFYAKDGDEKIILSARKDGSIVRNLDDSNNYLNLVNLEKYINDLYVDIYCDHQIETVKLIATLELANNRFINVNNDNSAIAEYDNEIDIRKNLPKFINENFTYDKAVKKYKWEQIIDGEELKFEYYAKSRELIIDNGEDKFIYNYDNKCLNLYDDKNDKLFTYDLNDNFCLFGNCTKYRKIIDITKSIINV